MPDSEPTPGRPRVWPRGSLVAGFSDAARADLMSLGTVSEHPPGHRLIAQGDTSTDVFILDLGAVKVTADTEDGAVALLAVRVAGDAVGELASLDAQPRLANVTTAGRVRARRISRAAFVAFLRRHPDAAVVVSSSVSAKFRWATRRRIEFGAYPVAVRLARLLDELARQHGYPVPEGLAVGVELSQPELAALIGATEPSVQRALRQLRDSHTLTTGYRQLVITDLAALRRSGHLSEDQPGTP